MAAHRVNGDSYDTVTAAKTTFKHLLRDQTIALSDELRNSASKVKITGPGGEPAIPSPWKEAEAITALKALEASLAIALGRLRYPELGEQTAELDSDHATAFLFMSYLSTLDGFGKWDKRVVPKLKPTDIHQAQSNLYRRLSANIYKTSVPDQYYHTHGSLEASPILNALSLPGFLPNDPLPSYDEICNIIQTQTQKFTPEELDSKTSSLKQAGCIVYKDTDFLATPQGRALTAESLITCNKLESTNPPAPFHPPPTNPIPSLIAPSDTRPQLLSGIRVLDLTRVIAGPCIGRTLAEYGASVLKVTSPNLPDVPYYQVDLNFGKHTTDLNLRDPSDRNKFEALLDAGVDVIVDGYRTGSLERLGYGPHDLKKRFESRGKGIVFVRENCFGFSGPMRERSGWQPVADAVSGLAWGHGEAMGLGQPVLPPFPMSDYGTGELGACAALLGLYKRATEGGSWELGVSLTKYNLWVMGLGMYPDDVWQKVLADHRPEIEEFGLGHLANFDVVSKAAIKSMRRLHDKRFFDDRFMVELKGEGFGEPGVIKTCRPVVKTSGMRNGWNTTTRPNGWDGPHWW